MTTITLEIPETLANRLAPLRDKLPQILSTALDLCSTERPLASGTPEAAHSAFNEMLDFLAGGPTPEQIIAFKLSPATQARLEELLDKNREAELTNEETAELDVYKQINHILILLKARARSMLSATSSRP